MKKNAIRAVLCILAVLLAVMFWQFNGDKQEASHPLNELYKAVEGKDIAKVDVSITSDDWQRYTVIFKGGQTRTYIVPTDSAKSLMPRLVERGTPVIITTSWWADTLIRHGPILLLILVFVYSVRSQLALFRGKIAHGKEQTSTITFQDVGGSDEAKQELQETVAHLKDPDRLKRLGGKPPKGILLIGPPGTGKTLLARAVAGEAGVPFFSLSGSAFTEKYVGVGASRVRQLFEQAKKQTPSIVFIDELDAVGRMRAEEGEASNQEGEQTLNQLLVEMDGFEGDTDIIVLAATNRPEILDDAIRRPGRFDRTVMVALPDVRDRQRILEATVQRRDAPLGVDIDLALIARSTPGFSGADLANLVNEAALHAARLQKDALHPDDFDAARDRVIMGLGNERILSPKERKIIATHESGHTLVAHYLSDSHPIYKVTIISRGGSQGALWRLPDEDHFTDSRKRLIADMAVALGGRLAEEKLGTPDDVTSGAADDLDKVTMIARRMVTEWGFRAHEGKRIGYQVYRESDYLLSDAQAEYIQTEITALIEEARALAMQIIDQRTKELNLLIEELLKRETLTRNEIHALLPLS